MFERQDVWVLSEANPWHPTLEWYARAIPVLQGRDGNNFADPTSWGYLSAIHEVNPLTVPSPAPPGATWTECQHDSWFFLPWHRMYLHYFERIVREVIVGLGGPTDWALPYWDYSNAGRPETRALPPAFTATLLPSGEQNALRVAERATGINDADAIPLAATDIAAAFEQPVFAGPQQSPSFGGPVTGWNHQGGSRGAIDSIPHGSVHMAVGGRRPPGWMSSFGTAALDPIFWLHHANIDRLWGGWLAMGGGRANPTDVAFLDMQFTIGSGPAESTLRVRDVLDSSQPPLSYRYSDLTVPAAAADRIFAASAARERAAVVGVSMADGIQPEMVGASDAGVPLGAAASTVEIAVEEPTGPAREVLAAGVRDLRLYLNIENIRGHVLAAGTYLVYVNLPDRADPPTAERHRAGAISLFGVVESSQSDAGHSGSGVNASLDITDLARRLQESGDWNPARLRVTFSPLPDSEEVANDSDVRAGRVSLYYA